MRRSRMPVGAAILLLFTGCGDMHPANRDRIVQVKAPAATASLLPAKIPLNHLGSYGYSWPPLPGKAAGDFAEIGVGRIVTGGTADIENFAATVQDTPIGAVLHVTFTVGDLTGSPTLELINPTMGDRRARVVSGNP